MSEIALLAYLSETMPESQKLAVIRRELLPLAQMLESTGYAGSDLISSWGDEDLIVENAFVNAGWIG